MGVYWVVSLGRWQGPVGEGKWGGWWGKGVSELLVIGWLLGCRVDASLNLLQLAQEVVIQPVQKGHRGRDRGMDGVVGLP